MKKARSKACLAKRDLIGALTSPGSCYAGVTMRAVAIRRKAQVPSATQKCYRSGMSNPVSRMVRRFFPKKPHPPTLHLPAEAKRKLCDILERFPRDGMFLDLGANFGAVTEVALEYGHTIYAFEPDPVPLRTLNSRFGSNPSVHIFPNAVGAGKRTASLYRRADVEAGNASQSSSLLSGQEHVGGTAINVEVVDIVGFLRDLNPTIVKMDIEGAEAECLEAILDAGLEKNVGIFLVEAHYGISQDISDRNDALKERLARDGISNVDMTWG